MTFFPLQKVKGTHPTKTPAVQVAHLEEECANKEEGTESKEPDGIKGVTKEFIVHLARAVKDTLQEEKHCYHCTSMKHFIRDCPLLKASRMGLAFKLKGGDGTEEGSLGPSRKGGYAEGAPRQDAQGIKHHTETAFLNPSPFNQWNGTKNVARVRVDSGSSMVFLDNDAQINTIRAEFIENQLLDVGSLSDHVGGRVTCIGMGNALTWPMGYVIIWFQVDRVQGYDEDLIALVIPDLSNFAAWVPLILGTPMISHVMNVIREREIDTLATPWVNVWVAYVLAVRWAITTVGDNKVTTKVLDPIEYDEIVTTKDSETIDAFLSRIIHVRAKTAFTGARLMWRLRPCMLMRDHCPKVWHYRMLTQRCTMAAKASPS